MESSKSNQSSCDRRKQLQRLDQLCDQYEALCDSSPLPSLSQFLSDNEKDLTAEIVEELIRIDLGMQIDADISVDIEGYAGQLEPFQSLAYRVFNSIMNEDFYLSSLRLSEKTYEVQEKIGAGGMAQIYRGFDHRLNRPVAIKMLRHDLESDRTAIERFENEAKLMAALRHEGIVHVYDVGVRKGTLMIVIELMEGGTLRDKIAQQRLPIRQCAEHARTISGIIHQAHEIGVIHLDLKPSNILLTRSGTLKVSDFGLARLTDKTLSPGVAGEIFGSVNYMSPEQASGHSHLVDRRTDVYGIGAVLYELLTGHPPLEGEANLQTVNKLVAQKTIPPRQRRRDVPHDLDRICMRCLTKNPVDRYQSARALENDLTAFLEGRPTAANPPGPVGRLSRWVYRNSAVAITASIAILLIVFVVVASIGRIVEERNRFKQQRDVAIANLYTSLVGEARAIRLSGSNGFQIRAREKIRQAIALGAPNTDRLELRNEIVASMGQFVGQEPTIWTMEEMQSMLVASAIHPDGSKIAFGLFDGSISIRQVADGRELQRLTGHASGVFEVVFSPQGNRIASVDDLGIIHIWTTDEQGNWRLDLSLESQPTARPQYVKSHSLAFAPDGHTLFCCPFGQKQIERWELDTNDIESIEMKTEFSSEAEILRFSLSSDASLLAAGTIDNTVIIWNRVSQEVERTLKLENERQLLDVALSPDNQMVAVGTLNGAHVFHVPTGTPIMSLPGDHLITLSFSPDSQLLVLPSEDVNLVRLWDIHSRREVAVLKNDAYEAVFSDNGCLLVCVSARQAAIWDLRDNVLPLQFSAHKRGVYSMIFSQPGQLVSSDIEGDFSNYDTGENKLNAKFKKQAKVTACYGPAEIVIFANEQHIEFYRLPLTRKSKPIHRVPHGLGPLIADAKLTHHGNYLVVAGTKGIKVWSTTISREKNEVSLSLGEEKSIFDVRAGSLVISDDEQVAAWVDVGGNVHAWDLTKHNALPITPMRGSIPGCVVFLPGTHTIIAADVYGRLRKLNLDQPSRFEIIATPQEQIKVEWQTVHIALAPNGRFLCIQRGTQIMIWDLLENTQLVTLPETTGLTWSIAWDPNSSQVALGYADGNVVVWELDAINAQLRPMGLGWE